MFSYQNSAPGSVMNPTPTPMNGTGRLDGLNGAGGTINGSYVQNQQAGLFGTPYLQQPGYPTNVNPFAPVSNIAPAFGACPTPVSQPVAQFPPMIPTNVTPFVNNLPFSNVVPPVGFNPALPYGVNPFVNTTASYPMMVNGFAGIPSSPVPFVHPMATIGGMTQLPYAGIPANPFAPTMIPNTFGSVAPMTPYTSCPTFGAQTPFGINNIANTIPTPLFNNALTSPVPGICPITGAVIPMTTPFGFNGFGSPVSPVQPFATPYVNTTPFANHIPMSSPFGVSSPVSGFNSVPGFVAPTTPWQVNAGIQSPIFNSVAPFGHNVLPHWGSGFQTTPFGLQSPLSFNNVAPWSTPFTNNLISQNPTFGFSPLSAWNNGASVTGGLNFNPSLFNGLNNGISNLQQPYGAAVSGQIGFGAGNCVNPFACGL